METLSPFASLTLHHQRVDWSDPTWDRDKLSNLFMGSQAHWVSEEHEWVRQWENQFGPARGRLEPIEIERRILNRLKPSEWGGVSMVGKPVYQHMLTLIKLMFPKTDITDTLADAVMFFCVAVGEGLHILNIIGGQNMSKTAATVRLAFATMFINPEFTKWTVANPFDNAASDTVWGEIEILWDDLLEAWPGGTGTNLFPQAIKYQKPLIEFIPSRPKSGRIALQNNKKAGKGKGAKSRKGADNEDVGIFGEIVDEINEIDSHAFLNTIVNKSSQQNYICLTSQNFKDQEDMGGKITEPVPLYGGPDTFEKLNVDEDLWWHSAYAGVTLRFDGHNSANILAGRVIYSYLFQQRDMDRIAVGGTESLNYMSQVRSFPVNGASANMLLSRQKLLSSRHLDPFFTVVGKATHVAFCDPAFGGRDDAVYGHAYFTQCNVVDGGGVEQRQELLIFPGSFTTLKLVREAVFNDYWVEVFRELGLSVKNEMRGAPVSYEDQCAIQCFKLNRMNGVPAENFGYDFSMRPDIVTSMNKYIGFDSKAMSYPHPPTGIPLVNFKGLGRTITGKDESGEDSRDICKNKLTEMGMFAADLFLSKVIRGGDKIPTGITQLCRTRLELKARKYEIEDKAKYKERYNNVSPDHRDVLMGIGAMAADKGFRMSIKTSNGLEKTGANAFLALKNSGKFKTQKPKQLPR